MADDDSSVRVAIRVRPLGAIPGHGSRSCAACNRNQVTVFHENSVVYSASYDGTVAAWALGGGERATENAKPCNVFKGHKSPVLELACQGPLVASGGKDGALLCWDSDSGSCLMRLRAHDAAVTALMFPSREENVLISGSADGLIKTWDPRTKALLSSAALHKDRASGSGAPVAGLAAVRG